MINLNLGMNYKEFIDIASKEHKEMIFRLEKQAKLTDDGIESIKGIDEEKNIVVFTETRCEDSATTMPFLMKLADLNSKIKVSIFRREGNEELLEELTGAKRVPTIILLDKDNKVEKSYIEFPTIVNKMVEGLVGEERKAIALRVRAGEFNKEIQEGLIKILK